MLRALIFSIVSVAAFAQVRAPEITSPEARADGTVVFRLRAPEAQSVAVRGVWDQKPTPMVKDEQGVWSATVGPLPPQRYEYSFLIDGASVNDPRNTLIKGGVSGSSSVLTVPGGKPWEQLDVPHGTLHQHWYKSDVTNSTRSVVVYTPPGFDPRGKKRYPVFYLLHGSGDTEREWAGHGNANLIADNLIAQGQAEPMIIAMPFGHAANYSDPASRAKNTELFGKDLLQNVVPLIEKSYPTDGRRALAGLSMGGMQTIAIGNPRGKMFPWQGVFSGGIREDLSPEWIKAVTAKPPKLLWIAIGEKDFLYEANKKYLAALDANKIKHEYHESAGGHTWINWREYLTALLPKLFR